MKFFWLPLALALSFAISADAAPPLNRGGGAPVSCTTGGLTPPPPATSLGYNCLVFNQDSTTGFDVSTDGTGVHAWYVGMWQGNYQTSSSYTQALQRVTYSGGKITLDWLASISIPAGCPGGYQPTAPCPIPIIDTMSNDNTRGTAFGHGYFEMVATITPYAAGIQYPSNSPGAWGGFWILGLNTGLECIANGYQNGGSIASPAPPYSELDTLESQTSNDPIGIFQSYHFGAAVPGCGSAFGTPQPSLNSNDGNVPGGVWDWTQPHSYGLAWSNGRAEWYADNLAYFIQTTTAATEGQLHTMQAWMAEGCGFVANTNSCLGAVDELKETIISIRVWSCTSTPGAAMMKC